MRLQLAHRPGLPACCAVQALQGALLPAAHLIAAAPGAKQGQQSRNQALKGHFASLVLALTQLEREAQGGPSSGSKWSRLQHLEFNVQWDPAACGDPG